MLKSLDALLIDRVFQHYVDRGVLGKTPADVAAFFFSGTIVFLIACLATCRFGHASLFLLLALYFSFGTIRACAKLARVVVDDTQTAVLRQQTRWLRWGAGLALVLSHLLIVLPMLPMMCLQAAVALFWVGANTLGCRLPPSGGSPPPDDPPDDDPPLGGPRGPLAA